MNCFNLTNEELNQDKTFFDHFSRIDNIFIASKFNDRIPQEFLESLSITQVIDLKKSDEGDFNDRDKFSKTNFRYFNFPVDDIANITHSNLVELKEMISSNEGNTLIYCMSGNRVSAVLAMIFYFVCGHPKERVFNLVLKHGLTKTLLQDKLRLILENGLE